MRVGASVRQHARIKRMHKEGISASIIAKTIHMTDQSLEKILAHLEGREEVILAIDSNPDVQKLRLENAELAAKLAKYEEPEDGTRKDETASESEILTEIREQDSDKDTDSDSKSV